jgi:hypothetical protein
VSGIKKKSLAKCPMGLFLSEDNELCVKTEYSDDEGRITAYILSSGAFFGASSSQTVESQRKMMVTRIIEIVLTIQVFPSRFGDLPGLACESL